MKKKTKTNFKKIMIIIMRAAQYDEGCLLHAECFDAVDCL